jgi:hypothetical protein
MAITFSGWANAHDEAQEYRKERVMPHRRSRRAQKDRSALTTPYVAVDRPVPGWKGPGVSVAAPRAGDAAARSVTTSRTG